jgi:hypothetical protein
LPSFSFYTYSLRCSTGSGATAGGVIRGLISRK